ncbi:MAG: serine--tRNA ligase [Rhodospirillaceae bacterium]|nr:serine--tRNA ligase [Rhodospirillaceae bacterium]|tara:strand:+ start:1624 stop:2904 length:1281 start_codon:yes stop_codon:yes gene_type:complete
MHDIRKIRQNSEKFDHQMKRRGVSPCTHEILDLDEKKRIVVTELQRQQEKRNALSKKIGLSKKDGNEVKDLIAEVAEIKNKIQALEESDRGLKEELDAKLSDLPNVLADDVPEGTNEDANVELRRHGSPKILTFKPSDHVELGERLGGMDFNSATKMAGARFVVLKSKLARLERALANFMLDHQVKKYGYEEISPPIMVNDRSLFGTGQLPKFYDQQFKTENGFWLIPTAEVPLTNLVSGSILEEDDLPLRFTAYTPCFRSEAGAAGKDTRGMIRVHQFGKVEMVSIVHPDFSQNEHDRMTECAESILKALELPFRTVVLCSGDTGFSATKTYDIEVWLPGQEDGKGRFREISSCSLCGCFQARRMRARFKPRNARTNEFVHTLNGSGLAVGRTLIAILENHQQEDGSVVVPKQLQPYFDDMKVIC